MSFDPNRPPPEFELLCDIVATDRLLAITGAGASVGMKSRNGSLKLPDWKALVTRLRNDFSSELVDEDRDDVDRVLAEPSPSGALLMEAATIIERVAGPRFVDRLKEHVTEAPGECTETHRAVLALQPRGILTFNYDEGHESAARERGMRFIALLPDDDAGLRAALARRLDCPFLLKAHGTAAAGESLVLSFVRYRELLAKRPAYRAFVTALFVDFHFVFVGFGLSDPDFDQFLSSTAVNFGAPFREHVAFEHRSKLSGRTIELRRRHGIRVLAIDDFADIPIVLKAASETPGPKLAATLTGALVPDIELRKVAHRELSALGPAGRSSAQAWLRSALGRELDPWRRSELAYTLGTIDPQANKDLLIEIVDQDAHGDPAARALTVLRPVLEPRDLDLLRGWAERFERRALDADPDNRLARYCRYLEVYVRHRYRSDTRP